MIRRRIPTTNRRRLAAGLLPLKGRPFAGLTVVATHLHDGLRVRIDGGSRDRVIDASLRLRYLLASVGGCDVLESSVSPPGRIPVAELVVAPAAKALGVIVATGLDVTWEPSVHPNTTGHLVDSATAPAAQAPSRLATAS